VRKGGKTLPTSVKMVLVVLVLGVCAVFLVLYATGRLDFEFLNRTEQEAEQIESMDDSNETGDAQNEQTPGQEADERPEIRDEAARQTILSEIHQVVRAYMGHVTPFSSNQGFLHNLNNEEFITIEYLISHGLLTYRHAQDEKLILFLRPADLADFEELDMPNTAAMTVFVGHETTVGIGLYSIYGYQEIFRENLNSVLNSYIPRDTEIVRPMAGQPLYQSVLSALATREILTTLEVRYMAANDDFVFVSVATAGPYNHQLRHYLFARQNGDLTLLAHGLENEANIFQAINHIAPNFDFLLPPAHMLRTRLLPPSDPIFAHLRDAVSEYGYPAFMAATEHYAYILTQYGLSFLATLNQGGTILNMQTVLGWQGAEQILLQDIDNSSILILRQE